MNAALVVLAAGLLVALALGLRARKGHELNLEEWAVGGRSFGVIFVFLLLAGEIYTTFTFLGGSGFSYANGGPALYILAYGCLAYIMSYWLLPAVWRYAKRERLVSQADFFARKYASKNLGILVALIGVLAMIPYLILQLKGMSIIVEETSYGAVGQTTAIIIGTAVLTVYVMVSGIHGAAWTAVLKDILILSVAIFLGIYLPWHYYGGISPMFSSLQAKDPQFLTLHTPALGVSWFISTVLLTAFGFYMWPHFFGATFSAKHERALRRNAVVFPLYQLVLLFIFFVGFAAVLKVPGLKGTDSDLALLRLSRDAFDPWFVGLIGATGMLTALVPGSMLLTTSATMLAKNVYAELRPGTSPATVMRLAQLLVPVLAIVTLLLTFGGGSTIVALLLLGYAFVTQLFPALVASLLPRNPVTVSGAAAGMVVGVGVVSYVIVAKRSVGDLMPFLPEWAATLNVGIIALIANVVALAVVSALTKGARRPPAADPSGLEAARGGAR
ncbi:sodium:solute symporter family protein [Lapillicoccus sp.]|uniref:sodium:solute symporter family protein n=1 Tax=Lapillicoccus sp. TaxID=1909287 RepID=UPI0032643F82